MYLRKIIFFFLCSVVPIFATALEEPSLKLTAGGAKFEPPGYQVRSFKLTNASGRSVYYDGYAADFPIWSIEVQADLNPARTQMQNDSAGWCGVGLAERQLGPHQSVIISVPVPSGRAWRLGIPYSLVPGQTDRAFTVSSPKLTIPSPIGEQKDASKLVQLRVTVDAKKRFSYTFSMTNVSSDTLYYGGYRDAPPLYINAYRQGGGWTDDGTCDWCGTGRGFQGLEPGQTRSFLIPAQNDKRWRIGLTLYRTGTPTTYADVYETVWWPEEPGRLSK